MHIRYLLPLLLSATLFACGPDPVFQSEKKIPAAIWTYRDSLDFDFTIQDTAALYNIYLTLSAADSFATENVYLRLWTGFPDGKRLEYIRSFPIFDAQGQLIDQGRQKTVLQENAFFNTPGAYRITIQQHMRADSLRGIRAVGLAVERLAQRKDGNGK